MRKYIPLTLVFMSLLFLGAQKPFDQVFPPDVEPSDGFRSNRNSFSAVMDVLKDSRPEVTQEELAKLDGLQLENIHSAMGKYSANYVRGLVSTRPGERIVGRALTIRTLPTRPDLREALNQLAEEGDWDSRFYVRAGDEANPGDVVVVDLGGRDGATIYGDVTALGMKLRGAAGVIIDGGTRDLEELSEDMFEGFPVFARFFDPVGPRWLDTEWNVPIRVGTATVLPGDIVVAEDEAVLFFPPQMLDEVVRLASERQAKEDYERDMMLKKKYRVRDVYPLSPELQKEYEKEMKRKKQNPSKD